MVVVLLVDHGDIVQTNINVYNPLKIDFDTRVLLLDLVSIDV